MRAFLLTGDADCQPGDPVTVMAMGCGGPDPRDDLAILCEHVTGCASDEDCVVASADPCCGMANVAVLATEVDEVVDAVGECPDASPRCAVRKGRATCAGGTCEIVAAQ